MDNKSKLLSKLCKHVENQDPSLEFTIIEIGARPISEEREPYMPIIDSLKNSHLHAFEIDDELCEQLNASTPQNITYHSQALGKTEEERTLFETAEPMCSSLYKPNDKLLDLFNTMEMVKLKEEHSLNTVSLDTFITREGIKSADMIKIDIQGAELDVFRGCQNTLKATSFIVSEVEFAEIYENQPLFSDVDKFLRSKEMYFYKFLGLAGRSIRPIVLANNPTIPSAHLWADAVFIKDITSLDTWNDHQLLKTALLAFAYGSPDLSFHCFGAYDKRNQSTLTTSLMNIGK